MMNKKMTPVKQKVITVNKSLDYSAGTSSEKIVDESIKAMQIIKKLEFADIPERISDLRPVFCFQRTEKPANILPVAPCPSV
jgi:hypothetical protein